MRFWVCRTCHGKGSTTGSRYNHRRGYDRGHRQQSTAEAAGQQRLDLQPATGPQGSI